MRLGAPCLLRCAGVPVLCTVQQPTAAPSSCTCARLHAPALQEHTSSDLHAHTPPPTGLFQVVGTLIGADLLAGAPLMHLCLVLTQPHFPNLNTTGWRHADWRRPAGGRSPHAPARHRGRGGVVRPHPALGVRAGGLVRQPAVQGRAGAEGEHCVLIAQLASCSILLCVVHWRPRVPTCCSRTRWCSRWGAWDTAVFSNGIACKFIFPEGCKQHPLLARARRGRTPPALLRLLVACWLRAAGLTSAVRLLCSCCVAGGLPRLRQGCIAHRLPAAISIGFALTACCATCSSCVAGRLPQLRRGEHHLLWRHPDRCG